MDGHHRRDATNTVAEQGWVLVGMDFVAMTAGILWQWRQSCATEMAGMAEDVAAVALGMATDAVAVGMAGRVEEVAAAARARRR